MFETSCFLPKNLITRAENTFVGIFNIIKAFYYKINISAIFEKIKFIFKKRIYFLKKIQNMNLLRIFIISVAFYSETVTLPVLKKTIKVHFQKARLFCWKNPKLYRFEETYYFSRILRQFCYLQGFWKSSWFFLRKPIFFSSKNPNNDCFEESFFFNRILQQIC